MKTLCFFFVLFIFSCSAQEKTQNSTVKIGGPCEGCEAIYEYGNKRLSSVDTVPGFIEMDPKIKLTGTVYQIDGKTPAKNVILYIYHTDRKGIYRSTNEASGWEQRHGSYRAWVKTNDKGHYTFYTFRPGAYPSGTEPEHIHITVKEPDKNEYYIDDFLFDDDPALRDDKIESRPNRAGSGIVNLVLENDILTAKRDIFLGLNIPDYY